MKDNELKQLLGELFPAGEVPDPHEDREPQPKQGGEEGEAHMDILSALALGPDKLGHILKGMAKMDGTPLLEVEMTEDGATLTCGDTELPLKPLQVIWLALTLSAMVQKQVQRTHILRILKNLGFDPDQD